MMLIIQQEPKPIMTQSQYTEKTAENAHEVDRRVGSLHRRRELTGLIELMRSNYNIEDMSQGVWWQTWS